MRRVLITGKTSFIGGRLAALLREHPEQYAVDQVSVRDGGEDVDFSQYDCVVHCAGLAHVTRDVNLTALYFSVNCEMTLEIARRARQAGVKQFIFLSSMIVYGPPAPAGQERYIGPDTPPAPDNPYSQSKLAAEEGLRKMESPSFRVCILRPPMVYGPGCKGNYALLSRYAGYLPFFPGTAAPRSAIHVDRLAEILRGCIDSGEGGLLLPQDENYTTAHEMLRYIRARQGKKTRIFHFLDPLIRLAGKQPFLRKLFGGFAYRKSI